MNIFDAIWNKNVGNGQKQVMSITTDVGEHRAYTYTQMFEAAEHFMAALVAAGVTAGDRVVIAAENSPEWDIAYLAIMKLHCTAALVDASLPKTELLKLVDLSDARCVFTSPNVMEKLGCIVSDCIPVLNLFAQAQPFEGHLAQVAPQMAATTDGDEQVAFIIYSSGTTKTATGIMHTHDAMIGTTMAAIDFNKLTSDEKMLVCIPNSHIYGVVTSMLGPLLLGGSMHFIESMTGDNVLRAFAEYKPTVFSCVPRVFEVFEKQITDKINSKMATATLFKLFFPLCLALREKTGINLGKVVFKSIRDGFGGQIRIFCAAGSPIKPSTMRFYFGSGLNLFLNYGLTETNVPVIANNFQNYTTTSCGKAYPHVQTKLVKLDDNGTNEIYLKTPFMMKGYFRDDDATTAAFEDGWFKTGDTGVLDTAGNISVVGRCKDNIVLSTGKKVTPEDIEAGYGLVRGVKEFVTCGIPALAGQYDEVHAFVVADAACNLSQEEIQAGVYAKGAELSQYMKLAQIHFVADIPKTSLQKPKRYLLKKLVAESAQAPAPQSAATAQPADGRSKQDILTELILQVHKTDLPITTYTLILEELGLDSLSVIELDVLIEEAFGKSIAYCLKPQVTVGQLLLELESNATGSINELFNKTFPVEKAKLDYALFRFYCGLTRWVYKVDVKGLENLPTDSGYIICPNHQTNFDFLWVTMKFGKAQFQKLGCMAKKELFNRTLSSKMLSRVCGMIPIDRDSPNSQAVALCKQKLHEGWNFLIYPEGTRTKTGEMGEFKPGAAMISVTENVPIVPVKIKGGFEIFPVGKKLPKLFDFKRMKRYQVEIAFAAPITGINMDIDSLNKKLRDTVAAM